MTTVRIAIASMAIVAAACTSAPDSTSGGIPAALASGAAYAPAIDPAVFNATVDNPLFPLPVGARWVYEGTGSNAGEVETVEVMSETRVVMGVECTVVRDEVRRDGEAVELTEDWYAQDTDGNVWYFGEETAEYEGGEIVSTAGAWEAGVDGALPGIIMPAQAVIGVTYRQEYFAGEAEDLAKAVQTDGAAEVPLGRYTSVLVTEDWTPLEPDVAEHKSYAPGVGLVMEVIVRGGTGTFELTEFTAP